MINYILFNDLKIVNVMSREKITISRYFYEQTCAEDFCGENSVKKKYLTHFSAYSTMQQSAILCAGCPTWMVKMEKIVEQGLLYDFYGELLTKHQQEIYESVVYENLSLGEIAEKEGVSRQAVHDIVKRCDKTLLGYEEKLKLVARFESIREKIEEINRFSAQYENGELKDAAAYGSRIRELSAKIMQEL